MMLGFREASGKGEPSEQVDARQNVYRYSLRHEPLRFALVSGRRVQPPAYLSIYR